MDEHSQTNDLQRESSLPLSLRPHLFSGPRDSSTRTTLQRESPDDDTSLPHNDPFRALSPLEPVLSYPAPLHSAPPFERHPRPFASFEHRSIDPRDRQHARTLPDFSSSTPMHRAMDPSLSSLAQRYPNPGPVYNDPEFHSSSLPSMSRHTSFSSLTLPGPRELFQSHDHWREGEAGPSSLLRPIRAQQDSPARHRRGSSQSVRGDARSPDSYSRESDSLERDLPYSNRSSGHFDRGSYRSVRSMPREYAYPTSRSYERLPGPSHLLNPSQAVTSPSYDQTSERQELYQYPFVGSLSISAPSPSHTREPESPDTTSLHLSESRSGDVGSTDGDGSSKGKRRREESVETDDYAKRSRTPRKTAVACNFCRGRKLRCNGEKPSCNNCTVRKFECEYVTVQRRRGPGKAPKGSRVKKPTATRSDSSASTSRTTGDRPSNALPEYELDVLAPEVRKYTSVLSLDTFGFQPPPTSPQYPSPAESHLSREYYSRTRTSRSRETSSEDRSDGERNT